MSLINEALKKAQRLRNAETPTDAPPVPGGGATIAKRATPRSANTLVLISSGAIVLVVLSVIATVYLLNRPAKTPVLVAATPAPKPATTTKTAEITPPIVAPIITPPVAPTPITPAPADPIANAPARQETPPAPTPKQTPAATTAATKPAVAPPSPEPPPSRPSSSSVSTATAATTPPTTVPKPAAAAVVPKLDERVVAFVESVRVAGIRSSGDESRVLMNDRVYRVNDIVDRTLGIRLVKVAVDSLTFSDGNGLTYVKYF